MDYGLIVFPVSIFFPSLISVAANAASTAFTTTSPMQRLLPPPLHFIAAAGAEQRGLHRYYYMLAPRLCLWHRLRPPAADLLPPLPNLSTSLSISLSLSLSLVSTVPAENSTMAKRSSSASSLLISPLSLFFPRGDTLLYTIALLSLFSVIVHRLSASPTAAQSHFEGFDADEDEDLVLDDSNDAVVPPLRSTPPPISLSEPTPESHHGPPDSESDPRIKSQSSDPDPHPSTKSASTAFDYWDEDEFEGVPQHSTPETPVTTESDVASESDLGSSKLEVSDVKVPRKLTSYTVEIVCVTFLIMFTINYFTGKRENENLALAWASKFATRDSIFEKNFSLLGVGETEDSPLLLKEGQNIFKFYASGRRFCSGVLATMELKSRHDLISRLYNMVVPCKDEITFEVYMNDDAMDHVVFALAGKKLAKAMQKEANDLQRFASLVAPPTGRKWVAEELQVVSESKEVAGDLITDAVLDQVFGDRAFEKFGKGFISLHFSDKYMGLNKKMLVFKFALPDANVMADMTRLVALVPYYIDIIGRYKLSSHARAKTEAARLRVSQEIQKELQNARHEALQKKKAEQRKKLDEAEAKLSAEAVRKKEAKERARQLKKGMPKIKMSRAH